MVYFMENYNFPRFQEGPTFQGLGIQHFQKGYVQLLIPLENYKTCDFSVGSRHPVFSLDPCIVMIFGTIWTLIRLNKMPSCCLFMNCLNNSLPSLPIDLYGL